MPRERSEQKVVHPSFLLPTFAAVDKENERHAALSDKPFPMTPGNKLQKKGRALTTGRAKKTTKPTTSLLHETPVRVPLSSKEVNGTNVRHSYKLNPFAACDVSLHENATKAKTSEKDDDRLLHHAGGPISFPHAIRVKNPHGKAR